MQENLTIARPYAQAAFDTAQEAGEVAQWDAALQLLSRIVRDPDMRRVTLDPGVAREQILALIFAVIGPTVPPGFRNFVNVVAQARRLPMVPEMATVFTAQRARQDNIADVEIVTAYELDAATEQRIVQAMRTRLGKEIRISQTIDANLIGGARVKVGDLVFDASLKGALSQLANVFNIK
ncbi:MAG: F0F1 ATP synthase subunit delta [Gammaproteobacteria bacterium]|nr:F0F1 ATP synthase subunit delta [Gammaproteobacteria bacterium]